MEQSKKLAGKATERPNSNLASLGKSSRVRQTRRERTGDRRARATEKESAR